MADISARATLAGQPASSVRLSVLLGIVTWWCVHSRRRVSRAALQAAFPYLGSLPHPLPKPRTCGGKARACRGLSASGWEDGFGAAPTGVLAEQKRVLREAQRSAAGRPRVTGATRSLVNYACGAELFSLRPS